MTDTPAETFVDDITPGDYEDFPEDLQPYLLEFSTEIQALMGRLERDEISLEKWREQFASLLTVLIVMAYLGASGKDTLAGKALEYIHDWLARQLDFLNGFANTIAQTRAAGGGFNPAWNTRATMYATAGVNPFWYGETEGLPLPAMPGDGSSECGQADACGWEIVWLGDHADGNANCYWRLNVKRHVTHHCQQCIERAGSWNPLKVRDWDLIIPQYRELSTTHKHLPGQHDQKTHGRRGPAARSSRPEGGNRLISVGEENPIIIPKDERPHVVEIFDNFKRTNAPREIKFIDDYGNEHWGYAPEAYSADYMIKSDETKQRLRWAARLSDGRIVSMDGIIRQTQPEMWEKFNDQGKQAKAKSLWYHLPQEAKLALDNGIDWDGLLYPSDFKDYFQSPKMADHQKVENRLNKFLVDNDSPLAMTGSPLNADGNLYLRMKSEIIRKGTGKYPWEMSGPEFATAMGQKPPAEGGNSQAWQNAFASRKAYIAMAIINKWMARPLMKQWDVEEAIRMIQSTLGERLDAHPLTKVMQEERNKYLKTRLEDLNAILKEFGVPSGKELLVQTHKHLPGQHDQETHGFRFGHKPTPRQVGKWREQGLWETYRRQYQKKHGISPKGDVEVARGFIQGQRAGLMDLERKREAFRKETDALGKRQDDLLKRNDEIMKRRDDLYRKMWGSDDGAIAGLSQEMRTVPWNRHPASKYQKLQRELNKANQEYDALGSEMSDNWKELASNGTKLEQLNAEAKAGGYHTWASGDKPIHGAVAASSQARRAAMASLQRESATKRADLERQLAKQGLSKAEGLADHHEHLSEVYYQQFRDLEKKQQAGEAVDQGKLDWYKERWKAQSNTAAKAGAERNRAREIVQTALKPQETARLNLEVVNDHEGNEAWGRNFGDPEQMDRINQQWGWGLENASSFVGKNPLWDGGQVKAGIIPKAADDDGRAFHADGTIRYSRYSPWGDRQTFHELGHWLEFKDPLVHAECVRFLKSRAGGKKPQKLNELEKDSGYGDHEVAHPDHFMDKYMGKDYGGRATEILSMGLEYYYKNPIKFMKTDPEYFDFIYAVLRMGL